MGGGGWEEEVTEEWVMADHIPKMAIVAATPKLTDLQK